MKEYINYYYHLVVEELRLTRGRYFFHDQQYRYMLEVTFLSPELLEEINQLHEYLRSESNFYHQIVKNIQGNIFSIIDGKSYILLRLSNVVEEPISIHDLKSEWAIMIPRNKKNLNVRFPWFPLWEEKIDYFENFSFEDKNNLIENGVILSFFIGMGENAISYLKETLREVDSLERLPLVPSHRRVSIQMNLVDFYNPMNIILDLRVRDIAEYIKESFWNYPYDLREIENFLYQAQLSKVEAQLLLSRLLFPSFYFDYLERGEIPKDIESRLEEYQFFITDIYYYLKENYRVEEIKWLKKKT